jgi:farnesyl diphosphate synthase
MSKAEAKQKFDSLFPSIAKELTDLVKSTGISEDAIAWFEKTLYYNCVGGKANRGISVVDTYRILTNKTELTEEEYKRAAILGWCVELVCRESIESNEGNG